MASALGVELLASLLNHPLKNGARANENQNLCDRTELGIIPQQVRGDLSNFAINVMFGQSFDRCVGCSRPVQEAYESNKHEFIVRACNDPDYLEEITGITEMVSKINIDDIECFDFDEDMS